MSPEELVSRMRGLSRVWDSEGVWHWYQGAWRDLVEMKSLLSNEPVEYEW